MAEWYFRNNQGGNGLKACPGCRNLVRGDEEFCPYCARRLRAPGGVRGIMKKLGSVPFLATKVLLGIIAAMFLGQLLTDVVLNMQNPPLAKVSFFTFLVQGSFTETYTRMGGNVYARVDLLHEYWRLVMYCFLHGGIIHILFNSWAFWDLGRLAERLWGSRQVFATFVLTGIVGGLFSLGWSILRHGHGFAGLSIGASGAVCGILGLLIGAYYRNRYQVGEFLGSQLVKWAVIILALGLIMGFDNAAHLGGLLSGGALGYVMAPTQFSRNLGRDTKIWSALAVVSLLLVLACFAFAIAFYIQGEHYQRI